MQFINNINIAAVVLDPKKVLTKETARKQVLNHFLVSGISVVNGFP